GAVKDDFVLRPRFERSSTASVARERDPNGADQHNEGYRGTPERWFEPHRHDRLSCYRHDTRAPPSRGRPCQLAHAGDDQTRLTVTQIDSLQRLSVGSRIAISVVGRTTTWKRAGREQSQDEPSRRRS